MKIRDLIEKLQKYPDHFEVRALVECVEVDDLTADFVDVTQNPINKIVWLELDGIPA